MNRTMILSVLGKDESGIFGILENNIDNLRSLTIEIRTTIITQEKKSASGHLKLESSCPETIEVIISSLRNIKSALDIKIKNRPDDSDELKIYSVRNSIIELSSNLEKISSAIERHNDMLLNKYNEIVIKSVSDYSSS